MSAHVSRCIVCERATACCNDEHALGVGDGGCYEKGIVLEFCSGACFMELRRRMDERLALVQREFPHLLAEAAVIPTVVPSPSDALWSEYYSNDAIAYRDGGGVVLRARWLFGDEVERLAEWLAKEAGR